jgi:maltose O-acetyltransferase
MAKTERDKMLAGELYLASDLELVRLREQARELTARFNASPATDRALRFDLLKQLFGRIGSGCWIEPPFYCDYGSNIVLGDCVNFNFGCVILDCALVEIGSAVKFGPSVQLYAAYHPVEPGLRRGGQELAASIRIGDNAWIGGGALICPGVEIGANAVIGAGSVVTTSIPANVLAVGNPCRVVRELT